MVDFLSNSLPMTASSMQKEQMQQGDEHTMGKVKRRVIGPDGTPSRNMMTIRS